jgi:AraC-like DNA-binding protein
VGPHGHHDLQLLYFERGGGRHRLGARSWEVRAGDLFLIPPGAVHDVGGLGDAAGWVVQFSADAMGADGGVLLSWRANPLLSPFLPRHAGGAEVGRFAVPEEDRPEWSRRFRLMETELRERRDGHREATRAYLTLALVEVARLAADVEGGLRDEPLLAGVFAFIEARYAEPISLKDVAGAVSLTPGHLATLVKRRTGRTVLDWISERRMAEARRLLAHTDEPVGKVSGLVGYGDPAYFARRFRRAHGTTPLAWRNANR